MQFFSEDCFGPGTKFSFERPMPSNWVVIEKISEHSVQLDLKDVEKRHGIPYCWALFRCHDATDVHKLAHMRIYMQVPIKDTEFSRLETRAKQASERTHSEVTAFTVFYERQSKITPALLAIKEDKQPADGLVPGGYMTSLVWEQVPGSQLGDGLVPEYGNAPFWNLPLTERNEIRAVFKQEYPKLLELGFTPQFSSLDHLVWDSNLRKLYFVGFRNCHEEKPSDAWNDVVFVYWGLVKRPRGSGWEERTSEWVW